MVWLNQETEQNKFWGVKDVAALEISMALLAMLR